jgi:hypothetical protein
MDAPRFEFPYVTICSRRTATCTPVRSWLADTACGYGCTASLPAGGTGFTTIELKTNFLGTAREGTLECVATLVHAGRTTQVWDATIRSGQKTIAVFRCTQLVLYESGDRGRIRVSPARTSRGAMTTSTERSTGEP